MTTAPKGTVVGTCKCIDCGNEVPWRVSAKGLVYYQCLSTNRDFKLCQSYVRRSPDVSRNMIAAHNKKQMVEGLAQEAGQVVANVDAPPSEPETPPEPQKKPVGSAGGLFGG